MSLLDIELLVGMNFTWPIHDPVNGHLQPHSSFSMRMPYGVARPRLVDGPTGPHTVQHKMLF